MATVILKVEANRAKDRQSNRQKVIKKCGGTKVPPHFIVKNQLLSGFYFGLRRFNVLNNFYDLFGGHPFSLQFLNQIDNFFSSHTAHHLFNRIFKVYHSRNVKSISFCALTAMIPLCGISKSTDEQVRPEKRLFLAFFGVKVICEANPVLLRVLKVTAEPESKKRNDI